MSADASPAVWAVIPARSGSKSVPHKNIRPVAGKPLLAWSIRHALEAETVTRVLVSTDSGEYAAIARQWGAETPFLRPADISGDASTDLEVFQHLLRWADDTGQPAPAVLVHLRPTCPVRAPGLIDRMVRRLLEHPDLDAVRTVAPVTHPPYKMWTRAADGRLAPLLECPGIPEPWNAPRQSLPPTFIQTANVDVLRPAVVRAGSMSGRRIFGELEEEFNDVDTEAELRAVAARLSQGASHPQEGAVAGRAARTVCFDIDGVIAGLVPDGNYADALPQPHLIALVNRLYAAGHRIVLHTARGSATGRDWGGVTRGQMERWGVRHHAIVFGKPAADVYVDDRMIPLAELPAFVESVCPGETP